MPQRCVLYYHLTWLTSPPIWWDSLGGVGRPPNDRCSITQIHARVNGYCTAWCMGYNSFSFSNVRYSWDFMAVVGFHI